MPATSSVPDRNTVTNAPVTEALALHDSVTVEDAVVGDRFQLARVREDVGNDSKRQVPR